MNWPHNGNTYNRFQNRLGEARQSATDELPSDGSQNQEKLRTPLRQNLKEGLPMRLMQANGARSGLFLFLSLSGFGTKLRGESRK